jgi:hypothetical protein
MRWLSLARMEEILLWAQVSVLRAIKPQHRAAKLRAAVEDWRGADG